MDKEAFDAHLLAVLREHRYYCKAELKVYLEERFERKRRFNLPAPNEVNSGRLYTTLLEFQNRGIVENRWRVPPNDPHDRREVLEWRLTDYGVEVRRAERRKPARAPA